MKRATLLYNPAAGRGRIRPDLLAPVKRALEDTGIAVALVATKGPGTAAGQARDAARTADVLFACGGDGTVHEVLQGLALHPTAILGVLPFGSANVLARHLRLSRNPAEAALQQMRRPSVSVPLGRVTYTGSSGQESRFFLALAGAGADGLLTYSALGARKRRLGRIAYYLHAGQLYAQKRLSTFPITYTLANGETESALAVSAMTSRVDSLGGLFRSLTQPASVRHTQLWVTVVHPPSLLTLPAWFAMSWAGLARFNRWQKHLTVSSLQCGAGLDAPVHVQADGEWLGRTPMTLRLVPDAIRLFCPSSVT